MDFATSIISLEPRRESTGLGISTFNGWLPRLFTAVCNALKLGLFHCLSGMVYV
jgi:hypothetical protein